MLTDMLGLHSLWLVRQVHMGFSMLRRRRMQLKILIGDIRTKAPIPAPCTWVHFGGLAREWLVHHILVTEKGLLGGSSSFLLRISGLEGVL